MAGGTNTGTVRAQIRNWLESKIRVDAYSLDPPLDLFSPNSKSPANAVVEFPMIDRDAVGELNGGSLRLTYTATFPFSIIYRYPEYLSKSQLNLSGHESTVEYLTGMAFLELQGCGGIQEIEVLADEYTVQIDRDKHHQNDWLVILNFTPRIKYRVTEFNLDSQFGPDPDETIVEPSQITIGVYRDESESLGQPPHSLDNTLIIPKENS